MTGSTKKIILDFRLYCNQHGFVRLLGPDRGVPGPKCCASALTAAAPQGQGERLRHIDVFLFFSNS